MLNLYTIWKEQSLMIRYDKAIFLGCVTLRLHIWMPKNWRCMRARCSQHHSADIPRPTARSKGTNVQTHRMHLRAVLRGHIKFKQHITESVPINQLMLSWVQAELSDHLGFNRMFHSYHIYWRTLLSYCASIFLRIQINIAGSFDNDVGARQRTPPMPAGLRD